MTPEKLAEIKAALAALRGAPDDETADALLDSFVGLLLENVDALLAAARQVAERPVRDIPGTNEITAFFHCRSCAPRKPGHLSLREWARPEVGWTKLGLQVWCVRCEKNVVHVDFQNQQHPANLWPAERDS